ncbi:PCYCGC domain-containing protein [Cohnella mopanensis]|uniref:PCYCGC domain-containing protein n=1 Tax=Cohnella mopanensis TaxID=2911966 RepID=UPI001EF8486A|nr:PCYCGC domain-containing protein [Cohnella mopanensis]
MKKLTMSIIGLSLLAVTACGKDQSSTSEHSHHASNGDLRVITASAEKLPSFLDTQQAAVQVAYQVAATLSDTLQWIPCYCGCGDSAGHKSNLNCFINEIREDGSVEWDDHGTRCGVCVQIAMVSAQMKQDGKTNLEIRNYIDSKYGSGYANPTDTPMPIS